MYIMTRYSVFNFQSQISIIPKVKEQKRNFLSHFQNIQTFLNNSESAPSLHSYSTSCDFPIRRHVWPAFSWWAGERHRPRHDADHREPPSFSQHFSGSLPWFPVWDGNGLKLPSHQGQWRLSSTQTSTKFSIWKNIMIRTQNSHNCALPFTRGDFGWNYNAYLSGLQIDIWHPWQVNKNVDRVWTGIMDGDGICLGGAQGEQRCWQPVICHSW